MAGKLESNRKFRDQRRKTHKLINGWIPKSAWDNICCFADYLSRKEGYPITPYGVIGNWGMKLEIPQGDRKAPQPLRAAASSPRANAG